MLITCRECGSSVSDSAPTCPNCGVPSPAGSSAKLVVHRKSKLGGAAIPHNLYLNGKYMDKVKNGGTVSINVSPGAYTFGVECLAAIGPALYGGCEVELKHNDTVTLEIYPKGLGIAVTKC